MSSITVAKRSRSSPSRPIRQLDLILLFTRGLILAPRGGGGVGGVVVVVGGNPENTQPLSPFAGFIH